MTLARLAKYLIASQQLEANLTSRISLDSEV
jgi:hypothetical protein